MELEAGVDRGVDSARNQLGAEELESAGGALKGFHEVKVNIKRNMRAQIRVYLLL